MNKGSNCWIAYGGRAALVYDAAYTCLWLITRPFT